MFHIGHEAEWAFQVQTGLLHLVAYDEESNAWDTYGLGKSLQDSVLMWNIKTYVLTNVPHWS